MTMSIDTLLQAAEYLDRRDRGEENVNFSLLFSFFVWQTTSTWRFILMSTSIVASISWYSYFYYFTVFYSRLNHYGLIGWIFNDSWEIDTLWMWFFDGRWWKKIFFFFLDLGIDNRKKMLLKFVLELCCEFYW